MVTLRTRGALAAVALSCAAALTPATAAEAATEGGRVGPSGCAPFGEPPATKNTQCEGIVVHAFGSAAMAVVLGGRRTDFADAAELTAAGCAGRTEQLLPAPMFEMLPKGPDPLYAAVEHDVDVSRITPAPHWRKDCRPLYRSDGRDPSAVFEQGFAPEDAVNGQYDVTGYVLRSRPSPFVGAGYGHEPAGKGTKALWEYVIDAPGGIDVNATIGERHPNAERLEVAFPGGLDRRFIVKACPVDPGTGTSGSGCVDNPDYRPWLSR